MKLHKSLMLLGALVLVFALSTPVLAANIVELPTKLTASNGATQQGWLTNGTDNVTADLTAEQVISAKYLVLELGAAPTGGMQFIWQGDGDGWNWNQTDGIVPDSGTDATTIVIDLAAKAKNYDAMAKSTQIKMFIGYYSSGVADLQITRAYLTDTDPATAGAAAAPAADANPKTGEGMFIYIALLALAVTAYGTLFFFRKAKAQ